VLQRFQRYFKAPRERVYRAITEHCERWMPTLLPFTERISEERVVQSMRGETITMALIEDRGGTYLAVVHEGFSGDAAKNQAAWSDAFKRLTKLL
jgi:uncharacterized protein YndB with AHSA1/START domain